MTVIQAILLAIIEGLTEFLPVSSTGHMVICSSFMGIASDPFVKLFTVVIQLGCILSVVAIYYKRFLKSVNFYTKLIVGSIPAGILGLIFKKKIDIMLESPIGVAIVLIVGGIILLFVDKLFNKGIDDNADEISLIQAFKIGCFQAIAICPGVSRSAATITGGMILGLTRKAAAEFAFFLALPIMFAATLKDVKDYFDDGHILNTDQVNLLVIGNVVAFIIGLLAVKYFISLLTKFGFKAFGIYRIALGIVIIVLMSQGFKLTTI
ncbi:MAG: hypothetical protein RLZZ175_1862 [Bacteroidota bacterium]|jgi:undecaprenyl-diphosphatase